MASEYVALGDIVRFGITTSNPSGGALTNTDITPMWYAFVNDSDTPLTSGNFTLRGGLTGAYRAKFTAGTTLGFNTSDYVEIHASGMVNGIPGRAVVKTFVIDDPYNSNLTQISGVTIANSNYIEGRVWNAQQSQYNTNGTFGSGLGFTSQSIYYANIKFIKDSVVPDDEYSAQWFKDANPLPSGRVTNSAISVYKTSDQNSLFTNQKLDYFSVNHGTMRYNEITTLAVSGEAYLASISGTIDGQTRVWTNIIGLDYL